MNELDKTWHLAETAHEIKVTDFEFLLWRVFNAFLRWQQECEKSTNNNNLTGYELAVLHIIRMNDRPKSIYDIGRLLNRNDTFNIQYSLRKLLKMGLIEKSKTNSQRNLTYQITEKGIKNTNTYTQARKNILIEMFTKEYDLNLEEITKALAKLKVLYDEADRLVTTYKVREKIK